MMEASVVAMSIHGKYGLHLPRYRQIKGFERLGIKGLREGGAVQLDAGRSKCHGAAVEGDARTAAGKPDPARG